MYQNLSIIVAVAEEFAIGKNNDLLVHIPGDLKRFKEITSSHPKWPMPNRRNIVITDNKEEKFEGCEMVYSIEEAIDSVQNSDEAFIIGGGSIYRQFYPLVGKLYLTIVHKKFDADTFFPNVKYTEWIELERKEVREGEVADFAITYLTLSRK